MIWLASFPRSGNTFFRIILYEVYGIESSSFDLGRNRKNNMDYQNYAVVKTHLLPHQLLPKDPKIPAVYLVRDGRDALVSMAHHRKDIVEPGSNFRKNLIDAIFAPMGSHFGGWSKNVKQWLGRASIVLKFEDLIKNPIQCVEQLRELIDLPEPRRDKLPTFSELREKSFRYGGGHFRKPPEIRIERQKKFFRRGKVGAWRNEMADDLHALFWRLHGEVMIQLGYEKGAALPPLNNTKYLQYLYKTFSSHIIKNYKNIFRLL